MDMTGHRQSLTLSNASNDLEVTRIDLVVDDVKVDFK